MARHRDHGANPSGGAAALGGLLNTFPPAAAPARIAADAPLASGAYRTLLVVFNLFVAVSWMPRVTTIGDTDIGLGAMLLAAMVPLMVLSPRRGTIDRLALFASVGIFTGIAALLAWAYLGVYRLDNPFRAGRLFLSVGQGVILLFLVTVYLSPRAMRFSLFVCVAMLTIVTAMSLYNYAGGQPITLTYQQPDRSSGLFKNPNQYGMIAAMVVPFAVAFVFQHGRRWFGAGLLAVAFVSLMLAASKTNILLALVLAMIVMSYAMLTRGRVLSLLVILPTLLLLVAVAGLPALEWFNPRAAAILQAKLDGDPGATSTVDQRYELWAYSLDVMRTSPWFGEGTGQKINTISQVLSHSHNVFFDLGRTVGVPGMGSAIVFLLIACWLSLSTLTKVARLPAAVIPHLRGYPVLVGASFAVLSYVVSNQMSDSLGPSTSVFLWLSLGLVIRRDDLLFDGARRSGATVREGERLVHPGDGASPYPAR